MSEQSDQIGVEEIKRRVNALLAKVLAECEALPESERPESVRQLARYVALELDEDLAAAVLREGLVRIVRRLMRTRNKAKQSRKSRIGKGK